MSQDNIVSRLRDIERKQDETTRLVQSAVETAEKASDTASQLKAEVSVLEEEMKRVQLDTKSTMARLQTDILKETADRISREANVILIGLDEPATDTDQTAIKTNLILCSLRKQKWPRKLKKKTSSRPDAWASKAAATGSLVIVRAHSW